MGLLNFDFLGGQTPYDSFLTPEQQQELKRQARLAMGIQMMMSNSSGLGGIGQGIAAGQDTYFSNAKSIYDSQVEAQKLEMERKLQQLKLDDYQRKVNLQDRISAILNGEAPAQGSPAPSMGGQAEAAPGPAMSAGIPMPTMGADGSITDASVPPAPASPVMAAAPQMTDKQKKAALYRKVADAIAAADPEKADKYYAMADKIDPLPDYGTPQEAMVGGKRRLVQYDKRGGYRIVDGIDPAISLPSEVGAVEYITGTPLAGSGQAGMDAVGNYNRSKASNVTVNNSPQGKGEVAYYEALGKRIPELEAQAVTANRTNQALQEMIQLNKSKTFTGSLAPGAVGAAQFLNSLGVSVAPDRLANTREFQASANILVLDFMSAMGGARGFSKEESAILYDAFPKIIDDPKARDRIANMLIRRNNRVLGEYQAVKRQFETGTGRQLPGIDIIPVDPTMPAPAPAAVQPAKTYNPKTGQWE